MCLLVFIFGLGFGAKASVWTQSGTDFSVGSSIDLDVGSENITLHKKSILSEFNNTISEDVSGNNATYTRNSTALNDDLTSAAVDIPRYNTEQGDNSSSRDDLGEREITFAVTDSPEVGNNGCLVGGEGTYIDDHGNYGYQRLAAAVTDWNSVGVDFSVIVGDNINGRTQNWPTFWSQLESASNPVYEVVGNHDYDEDGDANYQGIDPWLTHNNTSVPWYSFEQQGVLFIFLAYEKNPDGSICNGSDAGGYSSVSCIQDAQFDWFNNLIQTNTDKDIIIFAHHPVYDSGVMNDDSYMGKLGYLGGHFAEINNIIQNTDNIRAVFTGHLQGDDYRARWQTKGMTATKYGKMFSMSGELVPHGQWVGGDACQPGATWVPSDFNQTRIVTITQDRIIIKARDYYTHEYIPGLDYEIPTSYAQIKSLTMEESATNLLSQNSISTSFESNDTGWTATNGTKTRVADSGAVGNYVLRVVDGSANQGRAVSSKFAVSPNTTYAFSACAKADTTYTTQLTRKGYDSGAVYISGAFSTLGFTDSSQFVCQSITFTTESNETQEDIYFYPVGITSANQGTAYFDAVQMEQKRYATSFAESARAGENLSYPLGGFNTGQGSVSLWIKPKDWSQSSNYQERIIWTEKENTLKNQYYLGLIDDTLYWRVKDRDGTWHSISFVSGRPPGLSEDLPLDLLMDDQWANITATWENINPSSGNSELYLYVNGSLVGSKNDSQIFVDGAGSQIDIGQDADSNYFHGYFDEFQLFDRALPNSEILSSYNYLGGIYDNTSGTYTSPIYNTSGFNIFGTLTWQETLPANTSIKFQIRSALNENEINSAAWHGPTGTSDYYSSSGLIINSFHNYDRFLQYKAFLETIDSNSSPLLSQVDIGYQNQQAYTMGTDKIDISGNIRVYNNGQFINKNNPSSTLADLSIIPESGFQTGDYSQLMDVSVSTWQISGNNGKQWTESNVSEGLNNTQHTVGDLEANKFYNISVTDATNSDLVGDDCSVVGDHFICQSNDQGKISFTYKGGYSDHTFTVEEGDNTGPTTTASPAGGTYITAQTVTLTCNDNSGVGCDKTYYTIDGTDPTTGSIQYTAPLAISTDTTLKFFSTDLNGENESIRTEIYTINTDENTDNNADDEKDLNIHNVKAESTENTITITWKTDHNTKATIRYGRNKNLEEKKKDNEKEKKHEVILKNLEPNTKYYFRIKAIDSDDNEDSSSIHSIMTKSVSAQATTQISNQNQAENQNQSSTTENTPTPTYSGNATPNACSYTVQSGDTLWTIAKKVYGDATAYPQIIEKNEDKYPNIESKLSVGQGLIFCDNQNQQNSSTSNSGNSNQQASTQNQAQSQPEAKTFHWWNPFSWF